MAWLTVTHEVTRGPWTQWTSSGDKEKNSKVSKITVKSTKITKTENIWAWPGSDNMLANLWCSPLTTAPHWAKLLPLHERSTICASLSSLPGTTRDYQELPCSLATSWFQTHACLSLARRLRMLWMQFQRLRTRRPETRTRKSWSLLKDTECRYRAAAFWSIWINLIGEGKAGKASTVTKNIKEPLH